MVYARIVLMIGLAGLMSACQTVYANSHDPVDNHAAASVHNEPRPYDAKANAQSDVDIVLSDAARYDKLGMIILGANWCHDSRALAAHFEKPQFQSLLRSHYKIAYVDVGQKNRNIDIARRFGLDAVVGTPTVIITDSDGNVLNFDTAPTWRNAASRTEDETWKYFRSFAHKQEN